MKLLSILADLIGSDISSEVYGPPPADVPTSSSSPIVILSAVCIGIVAGIVILLTRKFKKKSKDNDKTIDNIKRNSN